MIWNKGDTTAMVIDPTEYQIRGMVTGGKITKIRIVIVAVLLVALQTVVFPTANAEAQGGFAYGEKGNDELVSEQPAEEQQLDERFLTSNVGVFNLNLRQSQAQASSHLQRNPAAFRDVLFHNQMERFADYTLQDALARMSGVMVDRHGRINLRGVGLDRYRVSVNGQRMATTGTGDRSFDLGSMSIDMVQRVEVIKVHTPDMDADGLGGTINLVTGREALDEGELSGRAGLGGNDRYFSFVGIDQQGYLRYNRKLSDEWAIKGNLTYQRDSWGKESLALDYDALDFEDGAGYVDVVERIAASLHTENDKRIGGGFHLRYTPGERDHYHLGIMINNNDRDVVRHREFWNAGGGWLRADTTVGEQGRQGYDLRYRERGIRQYHVQAGAGHDFDTAELTYNLGWSHSLITQTDYLFPFVMTGLNYSIDMEDFHRPTMLVTNFRLLEQGMINRQRLRMQDLQRTFDDHVDNTFTGRVDLEIPFSMGSFKLGSSARITNKDGDFSNMTDLAYQLGGRNLFEFRQLRKRVAEIDVFDRSVYNIPWMLDSELMQNFYEHNHPVFNRDAIAHDLNSEIWKYLAREDIYAGYGMATLQWGRLTFLGGVRLEYDNNQYESHQVSLDEEGDLATIPVTHNISRAHVFPNAQLMYSLTDNTTVQLAYSKTIGRPDFNRLAPFNRTNLQDSTIFRGNPELESMLSDNLDAVVEQHIGSSGSFSLGLFYKTLSGFMFEKQRILNEGVYAGFQERTFVNGEQEANLYGAEISWQQHLNFLPGFLGNFSTYANYTWSESVFEVDFRDNELRLPGHSPHVVNLAVDYSLGRVSTQVNYYWSAESMTSDGLQDEQRRAPRIDRTEDIYMDRYQDSWKDLSATMRIRLSGNFRLWIDARNLLGAVQRIEYAGSRDYPVVTESWGGRSYSMGLQIRF